MLLCGKLFLLRLRMFFAIDFFLLLFQTKNSWQELLTFGELSAMYTIANCRLDLSSELEESPSTVSPTSTFATQCDLQHASNGHGNFGETEFSQFFHRRKISTVFTIKKIPTKQQVESARITRVDG